MSEGASLRGLLTSADTMCPQSLVVFSWMGLWAGQMPSLPDEDAIPTDLNRSVPHHEAFNRMWGFQHREIGKCISHDFTP